MAADPSLTPDQVQARSFSSAFRGYDQSEVRDFLTRVAAEVRSLRDRNEHLESAWHSAEERAARPPVLDEEALIVAVGEETASILRAARAAASDLRARATDDAERIVSDAQARSTELRSEAEGVLGREMKAAEEASGRVMDKARADAAEMVDKARIEADALRASAQHERNLTIEGAMSTRERILEDLSRRRRVASVQIEQLRAGRERLLESYAVVRRTLEEVNDDLNRADAEARAAADEVGRRMRDQLPETASSTEIQAGAQPAVEGQPGGERPAGPSGVTPDWPGAVAVPPPEPPRAATVPGPPPESPPPATVPGPPPEPSLLQPPASQAAAGGPPGGQGGSEALAAAFHPAEAAGGPRLRVVTDDESSPASGGRVDDLFARLRSGRAGKEAHPAAEPATPVSTTLISGAATDAGVEEDEHQPVHPDEGLLRQRQTVLADLESSLTRRLKRALQDEQNDLLDHLRSQRGEPTVASLLPAVSDQIAHYSDIAHSPLEEAAIGGAAFAVEILDRPAGEPAGACDIGDLAADAATTIVESLRRRLEHAITASAGDDQQVLVEAVGSAYREWKSERIERIAGDVLAAAFSRGTWHEVPMGGPLRWVVHDTGGPCPDCDDDVLAGNLPKGEPFPTGQPYPPAHPGCRCLLVPIAE
jgi:DivIVA domain-containing protein